MPEQVTGPAGVASCDCVVDRPIGIVMLHIPDARTPVELAFAARLAAAQLGLQRPREGVSGTGTTHPCGRAARAGGSSALGRPASWLYALLGRHRRAVPKACRARMCARGTRAPRGEPATAAHRAGSPPRDGPLPKPRQGLPGVRLLLKYEAGQIQADWPSLGSAHEGVHWSDSRLNPAQAEQGGRLGSSHREVRRADFQDLAVRAQAADQRGLDPRRQHQLGSRREVVDEGLLSPPAMRLQ